MAGSKTRSASGPAINKPIADANCTITALVAKTRPCTSGAAFANQIASLELPRMGKLKDEQN